MPSISESQRQSLPNDFGEVERLVVYINDDLKEVKIDDRNLVLPLPQFNNLLEKLAMPFSILNFSKNYIYTPNEKQKKALIEIKDFVLSALMEHVANNLPAEILKGQKKVSNPRILADKIRDSARPKDKEFIEQFCNTQMLMQNLENNYCAF